MIERVALVSDFGPGGVYTGQVRLLLSALLPGLPLVELVSDLPPFRPDLAAYFLPRLLPAMPRDTLYLCVVDPGVGGERAGLVLQADGDWFVGPDNGLLALVGRRAADSRWWRIDWRPETLSDSFHGRDLFAPVAARIAEGKAVPGSRVKGDSLVGRDWDDELPKVVYQDPYGNLCTGLRAKRVSRARVVKAGRYRLGYARTFCEVAKGEPFWYENAFGLVELAVNRGRANSVLGLGPGDQVELTP